ncbi:MAG TPA: UDP-4-amino-4,6-dideoxy-N-acetyl-beta-L-altrosamine transaminase [Cytophagales bacterium]|nr:UDP-4-amino-4,6-dideoxy-N-acetyl-beta-L-altrosamine transaminase [Cytophagales bacterium]HAA18392.1 UDP-4-amino-4,6-dideoxy-N-acetyl-beta-L-altrosamine transaminase [Cytophagales bacterium]HAP61440.1 UDP-4-amino-4,6-dideoxy-N-acetyl-beta-L-altrosamine transaminase [Cytophagales bacterium]
MSLGPIPYGKQHITEEDIQAVSVALKADYLTQGPSIKAFEEDFATYVGSKYAVAVSNGTAALHLCALALGVEPGQKVITTPITFSASANCVRYCGGEVVFADIDPDTFLIDLAKLEEALKADPEIVGIIPVDFTGLPVNLEKVRALADAHNCWIIEDACHAPGGAFVDANGAVSKCGSGMYADLAIFSFHPVKHIAAGEGGMITTNNEKLYQDLLRLRTHGITKDPNLLHENHGGWYMEMQDLGYNYRLTDIQATLAASQLTRADAGMVRRREIAKAYDAAFANEAKVGIQTIPDEAQHAYHLYVIQVEDRKGLYDYLREHQIYSQVHYIPVHRMPYYQELGWKQGDFPLSEAYYDRCLSLPMFPTLTEEQQQFVIERVLAFVNGQ